MAESEAGYEENVIDQKSQNGWRKLRARLRSNEDRASKPSKIDSEPQDLAGFLGPSQSQPGRLRAQPKIDVSAAQRWSGASTGQDIEGDQDLSMEEKWRPTKPRRREGLKVGFVETAPEIIGEGGDEAETPVSLVSPPDSTKIHPVLPGSAPVIPLEFPRGSGQRGPEFSPVEQVSSVSSMSSSEHQSPAQPYLPNYGSSAMSTQNFNADYGRFQAVEGESEPSQEFRRKPLKRVPTGFSDMEYYMNENPPPEAPGWNAMQPMTPTVLPSSPNDPEFTTISNFRPENMDHASPYNGRLPASQNSKPPKGLQRMREDEGQAFLAGSRRTSISPASQEDESRPQSSNSLAQPVPSPSHLAPLPQGGQEKANLYHRHQKSLSPQTGAFQFQSPTTSDDYSHNGSKPSSSQSNTPPIYAPQPALQALSNQVQNIPINVRQPSAERIPSTSPRYQEGGQHGNTTFGGDTKVSPQMHNVSATAWKPSPQNPYLDTERNPPPSYEQPRHQNPVPQPTERSPPLTRTGNSRPLHEPGPSEGLKNAQLNAQPLSEQEYNAALPHTQPQSTPQGGYYSSRRQGHPDLQWEHNGPRTHAKSISTSAPREDAMSKDIAFTEFVERTSHMYNTFRLSSESQGSSLGYSLIEWLRAALWWFLKGRDGIERVFRGRSRSATGGRDVSSNVDTRGLIQPHVDLAKAWWIITDVVDNAIDSEVSEVKDIKMELLENMKRLCLSMAKRNALPSPNMLAQAVDNSIWVEYPDLSPEVLSSLSETYASPGSGPPPVLSTLPLGDSKRTFNYGRFFVQTILLRADEDYNERPIQDAFPCVLSLQRDSGVNQLSCVIASQNRFVYTTVRPKNTLGPSWEHVRWEQDSHSMRIKLPRKLRMRLHFSTSDFDTLWSTFDYTQRINTASQPRADERLLQNIAVAQLQYHDTMYPQSFPVEPATDCLVTLFERYRAADDDQERKLHQFYRLAIATGAHDKHLRSVFVELGKHVPVEYTYSQQGRGHELPAMQLFVNEMNRRQFVSMTFIELEQRDLIRDSLTGRIVMPEETEVTHSPNVSLSFTPEPTSSTASIPMPTPIKFEWNGLQVINKVETDSYGYEHLPTINSEHLRILLTGRNGSVVDRFNITSGALSLRLPTDNSPSISLRRPPREDATFSMGPNPAITEHMQTLQTAQAITTTTRHILTYAFPTAAALHAFQTAITGYQVLFDGSAANFAISRRRMVVPIYRKFDTDRVRLQIVRHAAEGPGAQPVVQLLAFFDDYSLADVLNFQLKSTDMYELSEAAGASKSALWGVKLVDAKFALPVQEKEKDREKSKDKEKDKERDKEPDDEEAAAVAVKGTRRRSGFVTLDSLEYPSEHEDITIGFDTEADRERFASALPAAPQVGRKFTLKRRI